MKYSIEQLKEKSEIYFAQYPVEKTFFCAEDGNFFKETSKTDAESHCSTNNFELITINKSEIIKKEIKKEIIIEKEEEKEPEKEEETKKEPSKTINSSKNYNQRNKKKK